MITISELEGFFKDLEELSLKLEKKTKEYISESAIKTPASTVFETFAENQKRYSKLREAIDARNAADKAILEELKQLGFTVYKSVWTL